MFFTFRGFEPPRLSAYLKYPESSPLIELQKGIFIDAHECICFAPLSDESEAGGMSRQRYCRVPVEGTAACATQRAFVLLALR